MKKLIPIEKRSKKEQKAWHARQRGDWNGVNPVTRVVPSKKLYNRKKDRKKQRWDIPDAVLFVFAIHASFADAVRISLCLSLSTVVV